VTIQITPTRRKQLRAQVFKLHQHLQWLWKASRTSHVSWETQALRRRTTELRVQAAAKKFIARMDDSLKISGLVVVARQLWAAQGATPASMAKASYTDLSAQVNAILGPMVADAMDVSPEELKAALAGAAQAGSLAAAGDLGLTQVAWTDTEAMWRELYPGLVSESETMLGNVAGTHAQDVAGMLVNATDPRNPMTIAQAAGQVKDQLGDVASWKAEQIARTETARAYGETALNTMKQNGIDEYRLLTAAGSPAASINPVCDTCMDAAAEGWVDVATGFRSGPMPPFHPNCRCDIGANTQGWLPPPGSVSTPEAGFFDASEVLGTNPETLHSWAMGALPVSIDPALSLNSFEAESLQAYLGNGYKAINSFLRTSEVPKDLGSAINQTKIAGDPEHILNQLAKELDGALKKAVLKKGIVTFRGINDVKVAMRGLGVDSLDQAVGATLTEPGFMSTTVNPKTASSFASSWQNPHVGAVLKINVPAGSNGMYVSVGSLSQETELLLPRGITLQITGIIPPGAEPVQILCDIVGG